MASASGPPAVAHRAARPRRGPFGASTYLIRRKVFRILGGAFYIHDSAGELVMYAQMERLRLRENILLSEDVDGVRPLLAITARQIVDFSAAYDVVDVLTRDKVGTLKRRGWRSMLRDHWLIEDADETEVGRIVEDSAGAALLRRLLLAIIPQHFVAFLGETAVCEFRQRLNPFVLKLEVDFSADAAGRWDRRLGIAAGVLLCAIEGRQD